MQTPHPAIHMFSASVFAINSNTNQIYAMFTTQITST